MRGPSRSIAASADGPSPASPTTVNPGVPFDQLAKSVAEDRVIVGDEDGGSIHDGLLPGGRSPGTGSRSSVPAPGRDVTMCEPPSMRARSATPIIPRPPAVRAGVGAGAHRCRCRRRRW